MVAEAVGHLARGSFGRRSSTRTRASSVGLVVAIVTLASQGHAADPVRPIADALSVSGGSCLVADRVRDEVVGWLGRSEIDARLSIDVRETPEGAAYRILRDGVVVGERLLSVPRSSCTDRHAVVSLAIAVAIDSAVLGSLGVTPVERPAATPPTPAPAPAPPAVLAPSPPPAAPPSASELAAAPSSKVHASLEALALFGVLPEPSAGLSASADIAITGALDARLSAFASTMVAVSVGAGEAEVSMLAGRADACAAVRGSIARTRACLGVAVGAADAEGAGFPTTYSRTAPWVGLASRLDVRFRLNRILGIQLAIDGIVTALRPRLDVVRTDGTVSETRPFSQVGFAAGGGPSLAF